MGVDDVHVLMDWYTGYSRGIAFITFADRSGVQAALALDGQALKGQNLRVNLALDRPAKGKSKGSGKDSKEGFSKGRSKGKGKSKGAPALFALGNVESSVEAPPDGCTGIVIKRLAWDTTDTDVSECFSRCGRGPTRVRLLTNKATGESKGKAILDFDDIEGMKQAFKLNGHVLNGRAMYIEYLCSSQR